MNIVEFSVPLTIDVSADDTAVVSSALPVIGLVRGVSVTAPDLDDTDTYTVAIKSRGGATLYSDSGLSESATTSKFVDSNNFPLTIPLSRKSTVTITASGTQAADRAFVVTLFVEV